MLAWCTTPRQRFLDDEFGGREKRVPLAGRERTLGDWSDGAHLPFGAKLSVRSR